MWKDYIWSLATCNWENGKYLASIMDDSVIMCYEIIESYEEDADAEVKSNDEAKSYGKTSFNWKKAACLLLKFLLITIALLIAVGIYCYLIIYQAKTKKFITISWYK